MEKPIAIDNFAYQLQNIDFSRIRMEIDSIEPLKPGVSIKGKNMVFWQSFVYENLLLICFSCRRIGHFDDSCYVPLAGLPGNGSNHSL